MDRFWNGFEKRAVSTRKLISMTNEALSNSVRKSKKKSISQAKAELSSFRKK